LITLIALITLIITTLITLTIITALIIIKTTRKMEKETEITRKNWNEKEVETATLEQTEATIRSFEKAKEIREKRKRIGDKAPAIQIKINN
jgi:hypothetical protein